MLGENTSQEDIIHILKSNHFVQEYLEHKEIAPEIKRNPRFQSIIWHISVMLKRQEIDFTGKEAIKWMDDNIKLGKQGEIMYVLSEKDGYYSFHSEPAIQFIKYFSDEEGMKREVKEIGEQGKETLQVISMYNQDGIEEKQLVDDKQRDYTCIIERIKNRPELRAVAEYDKKEKKITNIDYERRTFWVALEDLSPNLIEVDPMGVNPLLKFGGTPFYEEFSKQETMNFMNNRILPLSEIKRQEQLQDYKALNERYHRTKVFELGIAKMLMVRNREYTE